jgi:hypothetical protein
MVKTIISYFITLILGLLTISGGQLVIFSLLSFLNLNYSDNARHPKWFLGDTLSLQDKFDSIFRYLIGFTFFAFWGLTLVYVICKIISLFPKRLFVDRILNGLLTFGATLIISIAFGYYSSLDNLSIWIASLLGLTFGSTIMTKVLRRDNNTYA